MSTIQVTRPARRPAPPIDKGDFPLQEPPGLPEMVGGQWSNMLMYLPMMLGSGAMMLFFIQPGQNRGFFYLSAGLMGASMLLMGVGFMMRPISERKQRLKGERRDYLRYLGQVRRQIRQSVDRQRVSVLFTHPEPARLWSLVPTDRLWERRASHSDFAEVRIGLGQQRLAHVLQAPQTKPVEDLEPLCASALRRFLRAYTAVEDMPVAVYLRGFSRVALDGDNGITRPMARAILAQLATFHSPEDLRIAVFAGAEQMRHWDWVKWLPHARHPEEHDAVGPARLICESWADLERLLGGAAFDDRGRFEAAATPTGTEPFVVLLLDHPALSGNHRLAGHGYRNLVCVDIGGVLPWDGAPTTLWLRLGDRMEKVTLTRAGAEERVAIGRPDGLSLVHARALARLLAPYRLGATFRGGAADPATLPSDLAALLGVEDLWTMDPHRLWRARTVWDHLRVPIGINERGQVVELDLKESAQGGMGPHGILIGATGSGKSELIRTLVLSLAMTHSSEKLNLVLVDFKGGATFLGLDGLPHVSALITNLADELPLVDRMQDALRGELVRRQELLRLHGFSSIHEYERARAQGTDLLPLPTLVVIVDEFGELLTTKSEFTELFIMMGRLGRSLGVHLLLASQRFEEGRVHTLETHLSYRLGLRMFSSMESRSVIGTTDAYEQPLTPGTGYLRTDTTTLLKFRGAYVSGQCPPSPRQRRAPRPVAESRILPFGAGYVVPVSRPEPEAEVAPEGAQSPGEETVLQVIVDRLRDAGPPAHRVWLPPLAESSTLGQLLPPAQLDPRRGFGTHYTGAPPGGGYGRLRVPVALVDRPFEQRREPLVAELDGARGHVAVLGGPRSGKTNLLRTLVLGLALTHTPEEVQFYAFDFGGGGLNALAELPHVGSIANRRDSDRVIRTVAELRSLLELREATFARLGVESMEQYRQLRADAQVTDDPFGDVFLVIDGWFTLRQDYEALEVSIQEIATRGLSFGLHLVVASGRWSEIRPWLRDVLQTRFELRLGDPMESEIDFRMARDVPESPGRGMTVDKHHFLTTLPRLDATPTAGDLGEAVAGVVAAIRDNWTGPAAPQVRMLPLRFGVEELPAVPGQGELKVAYAMDDQLLEPVWHDFGLTPHLIVFGDSETGKTNLLRLIVQGIRARFTQQEAQILLVDPRRKMPDVGGWEQVLGYAIHREGLSELLARGVPLMRQRVPGPDLTPERLATRDWWTGPRLFVVIDDFDLISAVGEYPAGSLVDLLAQSLEIGLHVIVARTTSNGSRGMNDPLFRRMWDLGTPALLFSCPREEGSFLGDARPQTLPVGRAQLVSRRRAIRLVQTAVAAEPPPATGGG